MEVDMPATKKRKTVKKTSPAVRVNSTKATEKNESLNTLLLVFAVSMMTFAWVLYKVYVM